MKKFTLLLFSLVLSCFGGANLSAQCAPLVAQTHCYASGEDAVFFSQCADAGESVSITINSGSMGAWDDLNVYSGPVGGVTDAQIANIGGTGITALAGFVFTGNPNECLTLEIDADTDGSNCAALSVSEINFDVACVITGCSTDPAASNFVAVPDIEVPCTFAGDFNHIPTGTQTMTDCGPGNFYDTGGPNANYGGSGDEDGITTICPTDPVNEIISITFNSFNTEENWDGLFVYNGDTQDPTTLISSGNGTLNGGVGGAQGPGSFTGEDVDGDEFSSPGTFTAINPSGCLTFYFYSDGGTRSGWSAFYECVARPNCNPPVALTATDVLFDSATLTWTSANLDFAGHTWDVEYGIDGFVPGTGTVVAGLTTMTTIITGLDSNTEYEFYVTENCDGADGVSPSSSAGAFTTALNFCGGDLFTDNGGIGGNYTNNSNEETVICPNDPTCETVTVSFNSLVIEGDWDGLFIYDADFQDPDALIDSGDGPGQGVPAGAWSEDTASPGTITATNPSGCLTFFFQSDGSVTRSGWDANVVCSIPPLATNDLNTLTDPCFLPTIPAIFDPCSCNVPTELTDGVVTVLGNFNEELDLLNVVPGSAWTITEGMGFTVTGLTGGDTHTDTDADGTLSAGDILTDVDGDGNIQVLGTHDDAVGYDVTLTDGIFTLSSANLCSQPRPVVAALPSTLCDNGIVFSLEAIDALGSTAESVEFSLSGATTLANITEIDPTALTAGAHVLVVTFNGDSAPGTDTPTDVGCPVVASFTFDVLEGPVALACNDNVHVSLDDACSATITPDVILEGADGCDQAFSVSIVSNLGADLGDVVDGSFTGEGEFTVRVTELSTGNFCWGSIIVEDKIAPTLDCPAATLSCTDMADPNSTAPANATGRISVPANTSTLAGVNDFLLDFDVPAGTEVVDVNVGILLLDSDIGNLDIQVTAPDGTNFTVIPGPNGCAGIGGSFDFILDDDAAPAANLLCTGGDLQSGMAINDPFLGDPSVVEGTEASGTWTISVDNIADGGANDILVDVYLDITFVSTVAEAVAITATDNCTTSPALSFEDFTVNGDCGGPSSTLTRTWTATDDSGNTAQCEQIITFERPL